MKLFIDSTFGITVGLLDNDLNWLDYNFVEGQRGSAIIHKLIHEVLEKNELSLEKIEYLIQVAGPGSYTGMRVSEGIKQVFDWQDIKTLSFYHYQVPRLIGVKTGVWFCDAFKGETFLFSWYNDLEDKKLIQNSMALDTLKTLNKKFYQLGELNKLNLEAESTQRLIKENPSLIFKYIIENKINKDLYYFRSLDQEFTKAASK